jgi:1-deoxy-D-xylulose-5-phosphate synthase
LLDKINNPNDLKSLSVNQLDDLAKEIRGFLVDRVSHTGGHLASNLGVVELTIALHYVFKSPIDKFIWDVGHQCYTHKILTGRKNNFGSLRKFKGISGFPKSCESCHDVFDVGHSSTSISAALGFCISRDLCRNIHKVIAIIGDGAMTGGLSYEALNNAGKKNTDIIVILNDNNMSICKNVGAIAKYLNNLRTQPVYLNTKQDLISILDRIPFVGNNIKQMLKKTKGSIKYLIYSCTIFEQLGFKYIGPIDGHDTKTLITVFNNIKKIKGPILIHIKTVKGKGYRQAESLPEKFHGTEAFNTKTGLTNNKKVQDTYSDVFGKIILQLAIKNKRLIAITAAMTHGTGLLSFQKRYPERVVDVGIAEAHAVTFAAGLAKNNFVPVVAVYSSFLQRSYDQILHDVCIQKLHVVFAIDRSGLVGSDGETHQGMFDISFLSHMPNMVILSPKNKFELEDMLIYATCNYKTGPIAIRYPRGKASEVFKNFSQRIVLGESETIYHGDTIVIVALGSMMLIARDVYIKLKQYKYNPTLINARFVKPLSNSLIYELRKHKFIFILEENTKIGGLAQNILNKFMELNIAIANIFSFALPDMFIEQGSREELLKQYGLDATSVFNKIINFVSK